MYAGELEEISHTCEEGQSGCYEDSARPSWYMLCPYCFGHGCDDCKANDGVIEFHRCVNHCKTEAARSLGLFFRAFRWLDEKAIFPIDCPLLDQSFSFISACDFMNSFAGANRKRKREAAERFKGIKGKRK